VPPVPTSIPRNHMLVHPMRKSLFSAQAAYHLGRSKEQKAEARVVGEFEIVD